MNETTEVYEQKKIILNDLSSILSSNYTWSDKVYKVIGLKCQPEELPESLYFFTSENVFFKIPYITNQNTIIEYELQKNIELISIVLSYFELEEVDSNINFSGLIKEQFTKVEPLFNIDFKEKLIDNQAEKHEWMCGQIRIFESVYKNPEKYDMPVNLGSMAKFINKKDLVKYYNYRRDTTIANIATRILTGTVNAETKDAFIPNPIKKALLDLYSTYEKSIELISKEVSFYLAKSQLDNPYFTTVTCFLSNILLTGLAKLENRTDTFFYIDGNDSAESGFDCIARQFEKGFKYTDQNAKFYSDLAYFIHKKENKVLSGQSIGFPLFGTVSNSLSQFEEDEKFLRIAGEIFNDSSFINVSKLTKNDTNSIWLIQELLSQTYYNIDKQLIDSRSRSSYYSDFMFPQFFKEPECSAESLASKYKDMINLEWSQELTRTVRFSTRDLEESIRHRYYFTSSSNVPFLDQRNLVIDTMLPFSLFNAKMDLERINRGFQSSANLNTKTAYAISPLTAAVFGCKLIPIEHLCRILGYTKDNIKSMMSIVKNRGFNFVFVGAGGTGNNTAIWLSKMLDMCNLPFLFNKVFVFEKESAEIHNLLRFPKDPYSVTIDSGIFSNWNNNTSSKNKCNIIASELRSLSKEIPTCYERYVAEEPTGNNNYPSILFEMQTTTEPILDNDGNTIDFDSKTIIKPRMNTVFYGAPSIATRENLSNVGSFISATHSSNNCNIFINPEQDAMIQVESYGMIQLAPFFMNQLRMAIGLLEILSDDNYVQLLATKDHSFLEYEFDGESKLKNDRVYNFKIISSPDMATENQANTANLEF